MQVKLTIDVVDTRAIELEFHEDFVAVTVGSGLSEAQVVDACDQMGEFGEEVLRQWSAWMLVPRGTK